MKYEEISSRKNPGILLAASLADKKNRDEYSLYSFEGEKLTSEALAKGVEIKKVFFTEKEQKRAPELLEKLSESGSEMFRVTPEVYEKLTSEKAPQEIFCVARKPEKSLLDSDALGDGCGFVVLESVRDPSNVGAILRTSTALGCDKILLTEDCADVYSYKAIRAAMGAVFRARLYFTSDMADSIEKLKAFGRVYAAALCDGAENIDNIRFVKSDSIIIGNEGHGVSRDVLDHCTGAAIIPMMCDSESLNASVAAALFIWEKQRGER